MPDLATEILADNPIAYYLLNEVAGTVAANSAVKAKNYHPNPSFETNTSRWSGLGSGTAVTRESGWVSSGSWSGRVVSSGASQARGIDMNGGNRIPIDGGKVYSARIAINVLSFVGLSSGLQLRVQWQDAGGAGLGEIRSPLPGPTSGTAVLEILNATAPANAAFVGFGVFRESTTDLDMYVDAALLVQGATLTPYFDGSTPGCTWDGTANASTSTRNLNGTYTNGPVLNQPGFTQGGDKAVQFDGVDDHLLIPSVAMGLADIFSIGLWLRTDRTASTFPLIIHNGGGVGPGMFVVPSNQGGLAGAVGGNSELGDWLYAGADTFKASGTPWTHVVLTKNGATRAAYVNGALATTVGGATNKTIPAWGPNLSISKVGGGSQSLNGMVQHAAIYPTALSAARVLAHYTAGVQALAAGSIAGVSALAVDAHADLPMGTANVAGASSVTAGISPVVPIGATSIQGQSALAVAMRNNVTFKGEGKHYRPRRSTAVHATQGASDSDQYGGG